MAMSARVTNTVHGMIAEKRGGSRRLHRHDPLGSTIGLVNDAGTTTDTYTYWPYGTLQASTGSTQQPWKFFGKSGFYTESGTQNLARRGKFRKDIGKWISPLAWGYAYVFGDGNPLAEQSNPQGSPNCDLTNIKGRAVSLQTTGIPRGQESCGKYSPLIIKWRTESLKGLGGGFIIQFVKLDVSPGPHCKTGRQDPGVHYQFFELWYVDNQGKVYIGKHGDEQSGDNDFWSSGEGYPCTVGIDRTDAIANFYPANINCWRQWRFTPGGSGQGWGPRGLGSLKAPPGWKSVPGLKRFMQATWDCCTPIYSCALGIGRDCKNRRTPDPVYGPQ